MRSRLQKSRSRPLARAMTLDHENREIELLATARSCSFFQHESISTMQKYRHTESVSTRLTPSQIERLDALAAQRGLTRSATIAVLLESAFQEVAIQSLVDSAVKQLNTVASAHLGAIETLLPPFNGGKP